MSTELVAIQISKTIKPREAGGKGNEIVRDLGISAGTFYNWGSKYAGLEVNDTERFVELKPDSHKLKRKLVFKLLEVESLEYVLSKKW